MLCSPGSNPTNWHLPSRKIYGSCSWIDFHWRSAALTPWEPVWEVQRHSKTLTFCVQYWQGFFTYLRVTSVKGKGKKSQRYTSTTHLPCQYTKRGIIEFVAKDTEVNDWSEETGEVKKAMTVCRYSTLRSNHPTCYSSKAVAPSSGPRRQYQARHHTNPMLGSGWQWRYSDPKQANLQHTT